MTQTTASHLLGTWGGLAVSIGLLALVVPSILLVRNLRQGSMERIVTVGAWVVAIIGATASVVLRLMQLFS
jgi:hypothetical protein